MVNESWPDYSRSCIMTHVVDSAPLTLTSGGYNSDRPVQEKKGGNKVSVVDRSCFEIIT